MYVYLYMYDESAMDEWNIKQVRERRGREMKKMIGERS